jgi:hypothetical protein
MERRGGILPRLVLVLLLAASPAILGGAAPFAAVGDADGDVVLTFTTTTVTGRFSASVGLSGAVDAQGRTLKFAAIGTATGSASIGLASFGVSATIVLSASGKTSEGEALLVRGGLTLTEAGTETGPSIGTGSGSFDLLVTTPTLRLRARGRIEGSADGHFAIPADALTMRLLGTAAFELQGNAVILDQDVEPPPPVADPQGQRSPLDIETWPDEMLDLLLSVWRLDDDVAI